MSWPRASICVLMALLTGACNSEDAVTAFLSGNNAPEATGVAPITTTEDTSPGSMTLTGVDSEDTVSQLTIDVTTVPSNGSLTTVSGTAPLSVTYTPSADYSGDDSFSFTATDTDGAVSLPVTVSITMTPVNDAPAALNIGTQVAVASAAFSSIPNATDPDVGDVLSFVLIETGPTLPAWASFNPTTGEISGTPSVGDAGTTSGLRIQVSDGIAAPVDSNLFSLIVTTSGPVQLNYGTAPGANQTAGATWGSFGVRIEDGTGTLVPTSNVNVTLVFSGGSDVPGGTLTRTALNGIATFSDIVYNTAEAITLDATSPGLTPITGTAITVGTASPALLAFGQMPNSVEQQNSVFGAFAVQIRDSLGNTIVSDNSSNIQIALNLGTGSLGGSTTLQVTAGAAFFTDITFSEAQIISLIATSGGLTAVISSNIIVQAELPGGLALERASIASDTTESNGANNNPSLSFNGRFVAFESRGSSLIPGDSNNVRDILVRDRILNATARVSVGSGMIESAADSFDPSISANGNLIAFASDASNLVPGDNNFSRDIFVHDRSTGLTSRISVDTSGAQANGDSNAPSISGNGRFVAFSSTASNLVSGDSNSVADIFLHDRLIGTTVRVSVDSGSAQSNGQSARPSLSFDGRIIAFESDATNLVAGDTNGVLDVFTHVVATGATARVSLDSSAAEGNAPSGEPAISMDGSLIAFSSLASNLVTSDSNGKRDVFLRNTGDGSTRRASVDSQGSQADGSSSAPSISEGGRYIAYQSDATDLEAGDTNAVMDVYVMDILTGETLRLSLSAGAIQGNGESAAAALSGDGRYVAFESDAQNFVPHDSNGVRDIFVTPNQSTSGPFSGTAEIVRDSRDTSGVEGNAASFLPALSRDGRFAAFESLASNLVSGDTNIQIDIFVNDTKGGFTERVSLTSTGIQGIGESRAPAISADGRFVAYESLSNNFVPGDSNGVRDIFVYDRVKSSNQRVSLRSNGSQLNAHSFLPSISSDGRFIAFETLDDGASLADSNGRRDIYVHDRLTGTTELISQSSGGVVGNFDSFGASISPDGGFVAFYSRSTNLVTGDTTSNRDLFVRDRSAGTTVRVSVDSLGVEANDSSFSPSICSGGRVVVFESDATNLVANDVNGVRDIFAHDLTSGQTTLVSTDSVGVQANAQSLAPSISEDGSKVVFTSDASNLIPSDTNSVADAFVKILGSGAIFRVSVDVMGQQSNGASRLATLSGDGNSVSFESDGTNLVSGDLNAVADVFTAPVP